jgi:dTMP kinase
LNKGDNAVSGVGRKRGFLLSFEGIEGCGKSTQLRKLARRLRSLGYLVIETREPGGSAISEQIRDVLLDVKNRGMDARCELLLYLASRAQHLADLIRPSLEKGALVLCDRYADASVAYQGFGRGLGGPMVRQLNRFAAGGLVPNITILLDIPVAIGLERKRRAGAMDRLDLEREIFHENVRKAYLRIARQEPRRVRLIDGTAPADHVAETIQRIVEDRLRTTKTQLVKAETRAV